MGKLQSKYHLIQPVEYAGFFPQEQVSNGWTLVYDGFNPLQEGMREVLCTIGNGYFATRGASPESVADEVHYPGTYLAGGYNRLKTELMDRTVENEDLVNMPNWLFLTFRINGGEWFSLDKTDILFYRQEMDTKQGILRRHIRFRDACHRVTQLHDRLFVHMREPHLAALETELIAESWFGEMEIRTALDGCVINANVERYRNLKNLHLEPLESNIINNETIYLKVQTNQSEIRVAQTARTRIFRNDRRVDTARSSVIHPGYIAQDCIIDVKEGERVRIEKVIAMYTSRDNAVSEAGLESQSAIANAPDFIKLQREHAKQWKILWQHFDIGMELENGVSDDYFLLVLRLHVFHLLQTVSLNTIGLDVGVPARGWHGEAYRGHVFWDELFILPFLNFRMPEISRSLLMYRYRRLGMARQRADESDYQGAMYPWQSGSNGSEVTPELSLNPLSTHWVEEQTDMQRHINSAVAYNVWRYYETTEDKEFLSSYGAEMILETARFWGSMAVYNSKLERYEIHQIMGPDEFHDRYPADAKEPGLSNNTYTNIMAVWTLCCARQALEILPHDRSHELKELLELRQEELDYWEEISRKMRIVFHQDGIISQFEGYENLRELDWEHYRKRYGDIQRLDRILEAEGDTPNNYKVSKQADLLMLFYLFSSEELAEMFQRLGYPFEYETIPRNIDYYLKRTSHGSTLSRIAHSWVLARANRAQSWQLFTQALESDVCDIQGGTTREGIHLGAMAGTIDLIQRCYTGIVTRNDTLWLNPCLPDVMKRLHFRIRYRGQSLELDFRGNSIRVSVGQSTASPIQVGFKDVVYLLHAGETKEMRL